MLILSAASALLALGVGFFLAKKVLAADEGTEKMKEIAYQIQEGALTYLKRQFKTIVVILVPLAAVVFLTSVAIKKPGGTEGADGRCERRHFRGWGWAAHRAQTRGRTRDRLR